MAVPDNAMLWGLVGALSAIIKVAICAPAVEPQAPVAGTAGGVNVTVSVQDPPAGTPVVQLGCSTTVNLPEGLTLGMPTLRTAGAVPVLAIVTVTGGDAVPASVFPKAIGEGPTGAVACTAGPLSATICGLFGAASEIGITADRLPVCVGSNVTVITQAWPPAKGPCEQLSVSAKSPEFTPTVAIVKAVAKFPVFVSVTVCIALLAPTVCVAKFKVLGESEIPYVPPFPLPLSGTLCGLPAALSEMESVALIGPLA